MPLKIIPSRNAKTKNLYIRGTYLGVSVDKSSGTDKRSVAATILKRIEREIELGEYQKTKPPRGQTFLSAAVAYLEAGRRKRYVAKLIRYFGETPLDQIDQAATDEAAVALHPNAGNATRLGEVLAWHWRDLNLEQGAAWTRREKGGIESDVKLRPDLVVALRSLRPLEGQGRVFRFHQGGHLKHMLTRAKLGALGLPCPARRPTGWLPPDNRLAWVNFHSFRHTWATWMRRYGGLDTKGLVATRNWRDERSASRYAHAVTSEEWDAVERLPAVGNLRGVTR
jgi:integrase